MFTDGGDIIQVQCLGHVDRRMRPVPGVIGAVIAVQHVIAGLFEHLSDLDTLFYVSAEFYEFFTGNSAFGETFGIGFYGVTKRYREFLPAFFLDRFYDLAGETQTVFQASAVLICTPVEVGNGELIQQIAFVYSVDLHAVDSGVFCCLGSFGKPANIVLNLLLCHFPVIVSGIPYVGKGGRRGILPVGAGSSGQGRNHDEDLGTVFMDTVRKVFLILHVGLEIVHDGRKVLSGGKGYQAGDNQTGSAFGAFNIIIRAVFGIAAVGIHEPGAEYAHRKQRDPVGDFNTTDFYRRKKMFVSCHNSSSFGKKMKPNLLFFIILLFR